MHQTKFITRTCENCHQPFELLERLFPKFNKGRFCSMTCWLSYKNRPLSDRFWSKVDKNGPIPTLHPELGPCWIWQGFLRPDGYGTLTCTEVPTRRAHRIAWLLTYLNLPDEPLELDHLCCNRRCVNPSHLHSVSRRENLMRSDTCLAAKHARKTHCLRGHLLEPSNVYTRGSGYRICRTCTRMRNNL